MRLMNSVVDLVIFDCDGTLVDSELLNNTATSEALAAVGFPQYTPEYCMDTYVGWYQSKIWRVVEEEHDVKLPPDISRIYIERVRALQPALARPAPGIEAVLGELQKNHPMCVASNGEPENVRGLLEGTGLIRFFETDRIYTAALVPEPKPAPDLFLYAAAQYGVDPERCLVAEDSLAGAKAGVAAGMTVFGYTGLAHQPAAQAARLRQAGAHKVSDRIADLLTCFG
ncbi:MAG: HAD-IA family hydrolase [Micavibrio aeruginosavorus]|uniref:HAD-IA family hydrolase n=1 Tax=Micavibrio aeruginosavorus TaxID=349221 RepID=A0A7T5R354_9BACT|nr:MAG: HAD-IA family hydrolase [Micavibrio aeruginosavorus]